MRPMAGPQPFCIVTVLPSGVQTSPSDHCFLDGHVVAGFEDLSPIHPSCGFLGGGSAASTFFPSKQTFLKVNCKQFEAPYPGL